MRVHQTLICFFFLSEYSLFLHSSLFTAAFVFFIVDFISYRRQNKKQSVVGGLFQTYVSAQCGRYSIEIIRNELFSTVFYVKITNLRKSDSGSYTYVVKPAPPSFNVHISNFRCFCGGSLIGHKDGCTSLI
uniref:Immunoglobulin V-set domain-containing protein n=1 Tax=Labrus bergylta TaxID=56723 RepID=A0A3Q3NRE3_9LABR